MKVLRHRLIIRHDSVFTRVFTDEFDLLNDGPQPVKVITVRPASARSPSGPEASLPALVVSDAEGTQLATVPNKVLRAAPSGTPVAGTVTVTLAKPLPPGETTVLRLDYRDAYGRRTPWNRLFSGAEHVLILRLSRIEDYFTHLVVIPPPDTELRPTPEIFDPPLEPHSYEADHYHATLGDQVVDIAIPDQSRDRIFHFAYSISPEREERGMFQSIVWGSWGFSLAFLVLGLLSFAPCLSNILAFELIGEHLVLIGGSILAVVVGFLGFVTNPLTHRTKLWLLVPLVVAGLLIGFGLGR